MAKKVRYQVLKPVFVNGTLIDPKGMKDVFVMADEGLDGPALKLASERPRARTQEKAGGKPEEGLDVTAPKATPDQPPASENSGGESPLL